MTSVILYRQAKRLITMFISIDTMTSSKYNVRSANGITHVAGNHAQCVICLNLQKNEKMARAWRPATFVWLLMGSPSHICAY